MAIIKPYKQTKLQVTQGLLKDTGQALNHYKRENKVLEKALELACEKIWDNKHYVPIRGSYVVIVTETVDDVIKDYKHQATEASDEMDKGKT